jgi:AraC family transcriptional activator of pobA
MIRADKIDCALQDRVFSLSMGNQERSWRGVLLTSGVGSITSDEGEMSFSATCIVWSPWSKDRLLRISAGSVGFQFALTSDALSNAIGHGAESSELRMLSDRRITAQLGEQDQVISDANHAFSLITREAGSPTSGSTSMIEAQIRAVLVILWRNSVALGEGARSIGRTARILQHFRQLVETHFHDRWPIGQYANEIGISTDHLHDICTRHLGRSPRTLVQDRVIHEACLMLENTTLSAEQVSGRLGFRDNGHFSRFFKSKVNLPPVAYRKWSLTQRTSEIRTDQRNYADWP